jgi:hypothetical protein
MMTSGLLKENMNKGKTKHGMMRIYARLTMLIPAMLLLSSLGMTQCESWVGKSNETELSDAHVIYRGLIKQKNYTEAFESWKIAYEGAPAADGQRTSHYLDGIEIYKDFIKNETDEAKKKEYKEKVNSLYDEAIACVKSGGVTLKCGDGEKCINDKIGQLLGRKGYDMYYHLNSPYSKNLAVLEESVSLLGEDSEYSVLMPYAAIAVYQFKEDKLDQAKTRGVYDIIQKIGEKGKSDARLGSYYEDGLKNANVSFKSIERDIFDCAYFQAKWEPGYRADPSPQTAKNLYNQLKKQGCSESDPLMSELKSTYEKWASSENANRKAEFEASNPAMMANKAYKTGDFQGAISKYREAINEETDPSRKAGYHNSIASILFRKMKKYGDARKEARTALSLRPGWGKPLMMIGDMYATGARKCGDAWNQRLAVLAAIDKYREAKQDPEFASEAASKISKYNSSLPDKSEGHMRSVKEGQSQTVGCWIGERVKVRFQ